MEEILKILDSKENIKTEEIYSLLKTNSQKINYEIFKKIESFDKIDDFFIHYSNQTPLLELLKNIEFNSSKNYDEIFSSFDSNVEQYISCFIQVIISIKLILESQEILKKILLSSKQYVLKLKIEQQIENISQEKLFSFIENLLDIPGTKTSRSCSSYSTALSLKSCDPISYNLLHCQKSKPFSSKGVGKTLKILNEEPCTPTFGIKSDENFENNEKENYQNIHIRKDPLLTLSGEQKICLFKENKEFLNNKRSNYIEKNVEYNNSTNTKKFENLLEMINKIYKKCLINSEEKIKLKKLVIAKSKKLENLYYNTYRNKFIDQNVLRAEITKLIH